MEDFTTETDGAPVSPVRADSGSELDARNGIGRAIAFWIVAASIGLAAIAFGAVEDWAQACLRLAAVAALVALLWNEDLRAVFRAPVFRVLLPAILLLLWGLAQSLPAPRAIVELASPRTAHMQAMVVPPGGGKNLRAFLLAQAPARGVTVDPGEPLTPGPDDTGSLAARSGFSIAPYATRHACLAWLTPLLLAFVAARLSRDAATRYRLLWAVSLWTGVLGASAVAQRVAWNGRLLWIRESPPDARPLGPFVNPNHFAGYVELGVLVTFGLMLAILATSEGESPRERLRSALLDRTWALPRLLALGAAAVLGVCGLVLSGSRGGVLALLAGLLVLLPFRRLKIWVPAAALAIVIAGLAVGLASWLGPEEKTLQTAFFAEGSSDPSLAMRSDIWGRTWKIMLDHPLTGTGLGTFAAAYASYDRAGEWEGTLQAHNDYLQLAAETGIVGVLLVAWLLLVLVRRVLVPALRPRSGRPRWTTTALVAAVFAMTTHSLVDFNLQIPAVAALFAVLAGMLVAAADDPAPLEAIEESS